MASLKFTEKTLAKPGFLEYNLRQVYAGVAELVDAPHSKCGGVIRAGSSPATGMKKVLKNIQDFF